MNEFIMTSKGKCTLVVTRVTMGLSSGRLPIKKIFRLKGEFKDIYRFRIGDYRLFYKVEEERIIVIIADISHRKDAYK